MTDVTLSPAVATVIDTLASVTRERDALAAELASLRAARRWIPVGERLPEVGVRVWGWSPGGSDAFKCFARANGDGMIRWVSDPGRWALKITHWLPLPEPPEAA